MYWAYYDASSMTTYYTECSSMTATDFAAVVSRKIGKTLSAGQIPKVQRQSDLDKMYNVTRI